MLDPKGFITTWNKGAQRITQYSAHEIIGQHFSHLFTAADRAARAPETLLEAARREGRYEAENVRIRKDGSQFRSNAILHRIDGPHGEIVGFAEIIRDITEWRKVQEVAFQREQQFRLLVTNVTDYALYMLDPNGIITSWNAGAERIKGYSANEIIGQHFSRFYPEKDRAAGLPARALNTAAQEGRFEAEGWRVRKDGTMFWANAIVDPIRDEKGDLIGYAKITRDITERRDAQAALEALQQQHAYLQKMDALGQLTGGVAHDFNNLLMVVNGQAELLKKRIAADPLVARAVGAIERATMRGGALTRQLLTFSRRHTMTPVVFGLDERLNGFLEMMASALGASVRLVTMIDPGIWPICVDPNECEVALINVAMNARDAMTTGGVITLTAENMSFVGTETLAKIEGDFVAIRITDTGTGIASDVLERVFEPFFTTKPAEKGTGLGLSQVYGFAHQSGGTVTIESRLAKGTTVTLYLPRGHETISETGDESDTEAASGGKVLMVEDNPDVAEISVSMLEELGYQVQLVSDAETALATIDETTFDLVVSDIVMAGEMDGLALARAIRERWPNLPILLVTGYSHVAQDTGAEFTILKKPFSLAELSRAASRVTTRARHRAGTNVVRFGDARQATGI